MASPYGSGRDAHSLNRYRRPGAAARLPVRRWRRHRRRDRAPAECPPMPVVLPADAVRVTAGEVYRSRLDAARPSSRWLSWPWTRPGWPSTATRRRCPWRWKRCSPSRLPVCRAVEHAFVVDDMRHMSYHVSTEKATPSGELL